MQAHQPQEFGRDKAPLVGGGCYRCRFWCSYAPTPVRGRRDYVTQDASMATYETRQIKGWRSRMEDEAAELRRRVWQARARTVYHEGKASRSYDDLLGHEPWFHREFGVERAIASAELKKVRSAQARIARSEWTEDQLAARTARNRAWRARQPPETRERYNAQTRAWRAKQSDEWRAKQAAMKRARRAANPDLYRAIDRRYAERHRLERNARKRAAYARAPEPARAKNNAWRAAKRERDRLAAMLTTAPQSPPAIPDGTK